MSGNNIKVSYHHLIYVQKAHWNRKGSLQVSYDLIIGRSRTDIATSSGSDRSIGWKSRQSRKTA